MLIEKIRYQRLYETVIQQIENLLQNGELKPGEALPPERKLAEIFGVSRGTLREAFRILEREGVIESRPGGGRYVRKINKSLTQIFSNLEKAAILDLLETREILESGIAELVSIRASVSDLAKIEKTLKSFALFENGEIMHRDQAFHLALAEATQNAVLFNIMELHLDLLQKTRKKTSLLPGRPQEMYQEHLAIFEAVKKHDPKLAKEAVLDHLQKIREAIKAQV